MSEKKSMGIVIDAGHLRWLRKIARLIKDQLALTSHGHTTHARKLIERANVLWHTVPYVCLSVMYFVFISADGSMYLLKKETLRRKYELDSLEGIVKIPFQKIESYVQKCSRVGADFNGFMSRQWLFNTFVFSCTGHTSVHTDPNGILRKSVQLPVSCSYDPIFERVTSFGLRNYVDWEDLHGHESHDDFFTILCDHPTIEQTIFFVIDPQLYATSSLDHRVAEGRLGNVVGLDFFHRVGGSPVDEAIHLGVESAAACDNPGPFNFRNNAERFLKIGSLYGDLLRTAPEGVDIPDLPEGYCFQFVKISLPQLGSELSIKFPCPGRPNTK
jgi:hypothetical protein